MRRGDPLDLEAGWGRAEADWIATSGDEWKNSSLTAQGASAGLPATRGDVV